MKAWADEPPAFSHNCSSPWQLSVPLGVAEVVNAVGVAGVDVVLRAVLPGILSTSPGKIMSGSCTTDLLAW